MGRITIDVRDGIPEELAIRRVCLVVRNGRVSQAGGIKHFCWYTRWEDDIAVAVNRKRKESSADSFVVIKHSQHV